MKRKINLPISRNKSKIESTQYQNITLNEYLLLRFNRSNHPKYRKYAAEWISNLTKEQLFYFRKEMFKLLL